MTTQTTTNPAKPSQNKWRLAALLTTLTSLAVLLSSCDSPRVCWDWDTFRTFYC